MVIRVAGHVVERLVGSPCGLLCRTLSRIKKKRTAGWRQCGGPKPGKTATDNTSNKKPESVQFCTLAKDKKARHTGLV